jgi:hypothetical protein
MRWITALLPVKVHGRVASIVGLVRLAYVFGPEALLTGPGFDQPAVHAEVLRADPLPGARLFHRLVEKLARNLALHEAFPVLGEHRHIPHRFLSAPAHQPPVQQVVVQLLHPPPLAADAVQHHHQQSSQRLLRRNRRPPDRRVELGEVLVHRRQRLVGHPPYRPQWMLRRNTLLQTSVEEQTVLRLILAPHTHKDESNNS